MDLYNYSSHFQNNPMKNLSLEVRGSAVPPFDPSPRCCRPFSTRWLQNIRVKGSRGVGQGGGRGDWGELESLGKICAKIIFAKILPGKLLEHCWSPVTLSRSCKHWKYWKLLLSDNLNARVMIIIRLIKCQKIMVGMPCTFISCHVLQWEEC